MPYIYLTLATLLNTAYTISASFFNRKNVGNKGTTDFFNVLLVGTVVLGWGIFYVTNFSFDIKVLPYIGFFAAGYVTGIWGIINALKAGPVMLTNLIVNLSLFAGALWGLFFWNEPVTPFVVIGLTLVVASIFLCLYNGKKEDKKISFAWIISIAVGFCGNACCVISQKQQQLDFGGQHGNMLMFFSTAIAFIFIVIFYLRSDRTHTPVMLKKSFYFPIISGVCNILVNTFNILLATSIIPSSVVFPVISVGSIILVSVFSLFVFKERLTWWQWIGVILGVVATILLSIK